MLNYWSRVRCGFDMEKYNSEVVSVVLTVYNSSLTVLDTLDSIFRQNYENIELIITDDASIDNSVEIIEQWLTVYEERFSKVLRCYSLVNNGVTISTNKGVMSASGEWVALIAADDILLPNYLNDNISFARKHKKYKIIQSKEIIIDASGAFVDVLSVEHWKMEKFAQFMSKQQFNALLLEDIKLSPTIFVNKETFDSLGGCDIRIRNIEDYPLKLLFTRNGFLIGYLDRFTVMYRVHDSLSHVSNQLVNIGHLQQREILNRYCRYPYIPKFNLFIWAADINDKFRNYLAVRLFRNNPTDTKILIIRFLSVFNPKNIRNLYFKLFFRKRIEKERQLGKQIYEEYISELISYNSTG